MLRLDPKWAYKNGLTNKSESVFVCLFVCSENKNPDLIGIGVNLHL